MNFSIALEHLKDGSHISRAGWNGKGMWVALITSDEWEIIPGAFSERFGDQAHCEYLSFIVMRTADEKLVPWLASQTDLLAEDWEINLGEIK